MSDVDTLRSAVHIRQTAQEIPRLGRIVKNPKTDASRRTVVLPKQVMDATATHLGDFGCAHTGEIITTPWGGPTLRSRVSIV